MSLSRINNKISDYLNSKDIKYDLYLIKSYNYCFDIILNSINELKDFRKEIDENDFSIIMKELINDLDILNNSATDESIYIFNNEWVTSNNSIDYSINISKIECYLCEQSDDSNNKINTFKKFILTNYANYLNLTSEDIDNIENIFAEYITKG